MSHQIWDIKTATRVVLSSSLATALDATCATKSDVSILLRLEKPVA